MQKTYRTSRHSPSVLISPDKLSLTVSLGDNDVTWKQGILGAERTELIPYSKIQDVQVNQGPLQKSLGYGTVIITSGDDEAPIELPDIESPFELRDDIQSMIDKAHSEHATEESPQPETPEDEVEELARLKNEGLVTPEEFEERKRKILGL